MSGNDDCGPRTAGWVVHRLCSNYPSAERVCLSSAFCIELGGGQRLDAYVMFSYRSLFAPHVSLNLLPQLIPSSAYSAVDIVFFTRMYTRFASLELERR